MKRTSNIVIVVATVFLGLALWAPCKALAEEGILVRITGASLLEPVVEQWSRSFDGSNRGWDAKFAASTTGEGFARWLEGKSDLVMASRQMIPKEIEGAKQKGLVAAERFMGTVCLAIVTNVDNPVNSLTMDQLKKIYTGEIKTWKDVGGRDEPIMVTTRAVPETGAGIMFQQQVLGGAPYTPEQVVMKRYKHTALTCSNNHPAIGYIPTTSIYFTVKRPERLKVLGLIVDGRSEPIHPRPGVAVSTEYPISVPFYYYWNANTDKEKIGRFAEFCAEDVKTAGTASPGQHLSRVNGN